MSLPVLVWLVLECFTLAGYSVVHHSLFSFKYFRDTIEVLVETDDIASEFSGHINIKMGNFVEVIHPYFGYVPDPARNVSAITSDAGFVRVGDAGFVFKKPPDETVIGIMGGSFALGVAASGGDVFRERLRFGKSRVRLLNFASGGYKQPQQLMILNWLLAQGVYFDLIINIDGFNEVALPPVENIPMGVNPFYPRSWYARTSDIIDAQTVRDLGRYETIRSDRKKWAGIFQGNKLYRSPVMCVIWEFRDQAMERDLLEMKKSATDQVFNFKIVNRTLHLLDNQGLPQTAIEGLLNMEDMEFKGQDAFMEALEENISADDLDQHRDLILNFARDHDFVRQGPAYTQPNKDILYQDLVRIWQRSSYQMHKLCEGYGISYHHFLQPNQYVENSKPMTDIEMRRAFQGSHPYRQGVIAGYPLLQKDGEELREYDVNFTDLTMIFEGNDTPLYFDTCCHLTREGYQIVAREICDVIERVPGSPFPVAR